MWDLDRGYSLKMLLKQQEKSKNRYVFYGNPYIPDGVYEVDNEQAQINMEIKHVAWVSYLF